MALEPIAQFQYNAQVADRLRIAESQFIEHKNQIQLIFNGLQEAIDNGDTDPTWISELQAKKAQGKTILQTMLNGIT